jgi:hypothetical protein
MKRILFLSPLILLGMIFEGNQPLKNAKEEIVLTSEIKNISNSCLVGNPTQINYTQDVEGAPYSHCTTCGYGVFTGEEGLEKCTYCGIKKYYAPR